MKTTMLKILTASLLCFSGVTLTHAATNHNAKSTHTTKSSHTAKTSKHAAESGTSVTQKELRACAKNVRVIGFLTAIMVQPSMVLANQTKMANYNLRPLLPNIV